MDLKNFNEFEELLYKLSKEPLQTKKEAMLISPATYHENTTRANVNVINWDSWCLYLIHI